MLVRFEYENFKSFKDNTEFSMECVKGGELKEINTVSVGNKELVKSAIIFGPNASGKSNFFKALYAMKNMIKLSVLSMGAINSIEPYIFCTDNCNKIIKFEIEILIKDITYIYGFKVLDGIIKEEWLKKNKQREVNLFYRKSSDYKDIELYGEFKSEEKIKQRVATTSLMLTVSAMLNNPIAMEIINWFDKIEFIGLGSESLDLQKSIMCIEEDLELKSEILKHLSNADFGIEDFNCDIETVDEKQIQSDEFGINKSINKDVMIGIERKSVSLTTSHNVYDNDKNIVSTIDLPFMEYQSNGTKKLFAIIGTMLKTLKNGGVVAIDEIDSKLHPTLVRMLIRLFNSIDKNPSNAQLICSSHDVLLLDEKIRRDQIWFVDKDEYAVSELYALTDFLGVRKDSKLLKRYLLGVFNAVPFKKGGI
ncbi:AAA family ATPase [Clostridium gasigenes]|uniref:ATP-binding protein n=1 Tax=Clostridium gasigenes TaxID=94869 RepID=A0A7X0SBI2_9CLOT|nr:ATP-binding protein [Clostridium gasigenes]MBB6713137.1 ATP-binding protein [Clostridium gasigenes]